jgi:hypothetical protein
MAKKPVLHRDYDKIEVYGNVINMALTHAEVKTRLEELGYDETSLNEGKALHTNAKAQYDANVQENIETRETRTIYENKLSEALEIFLGHRKRALAVLRRDPVKKSVLNIDRAPSEGYLKLMAQMENFYTNALSDSFIKAGLARLRVTEEHLTAAQTLLAELKTAKAEYDREMAEDQTATAQKNEAIEALTDWMDDFYEVAKIAMEDEPQLLELLGMRVR